MVTLRKDGHASSVHFKFWELERIAKLSPRLSFLSEAGLTPFFPYSKTMNYSYVFISLWNFYITTLLPPLAYSYISSKDSALCPLIGPVPLCSTKPHTIRRSYGVVGAFVYCSPLLEDTVSVWAPSAHNRMFVLQAALYFQRKPGVWFM